MTPRKPVTLTPKQYEIIQKASALQQSGQLKAATIQYKKLLMMKVKERLSAL